MTLDNDSSTELAVFEFSSLGHYPYYLRLLLTAWSRRRSRTPLRLFVTPRFARLHRDIVQLANSVEAGLTVLAREAENMLDASKPRSITSLSELANGNLDPADSATIRWSIMKEQLEIQGCGHCLITYLDACLLPMAVGIPLPCAFSGILFRPTFHYPLPGSGIDPRQRVQRLQGRWLLERALAHPGLRRVFCLDPTAVPHLQGRNSAPVTFLPDPVPIPEQDRNASDLENKRALGIKPGRTALLYFGDLSTRKGIFQLLDALLLLPDAVLARCCLVLAGALKSLDVPELDRRLDRLRETSLQILQRREYVPETEISRLFGAADLVLAAYQDHVGMSGVLLRAAAHGKPVLTQSYGVMGQLTREHGLGLSLDTGRPEEIARGLTRFLGPDRETLCNAEGMRRLAEAHREPLFAETLLEALDSSADEPDPAGLRNPRL